MSLKSIAILLISYFLIIQPALAHCPLCTAATGSAVALTRFYGVDDLVVGTFIGGFVISTAFWLNRILRKRNKGKDYIPFQSAILILLSFVLTFISFQVAGIYSVKKLLGVDSILMGMFVGSIVTLFAFSFNDFIKRRNGNKNYIPFQVIFITLAFLLLSVFGYYAMGLI